MINAPFLLFGPTHADILRRVGAQKDCSSCGARRGELHEENCVREICPKCAKPRRSSDSPRVCHCAGVYLERDD
jgi:hypothetical protein